MSPDALQSWLKRKLALAAAGRWVGAVLVLLAGVVVLFLTFWLAYAVVFVGLWAVSAASELIWSRRLHLAHEWRLVVSGLFLVVLFAEWLRRSPWSLGHYGSVRTTPLGNALVYRGGGLASFAVLLANPQASSTMVAELLYTGPRLVLGAWHLAREACRLRAVDPAVGAWVLACLASRNEAVTREEFLDAWPGLDWQALLADVAPVEGVVFLTKGLTLTPELRAELRNLEPD